MERQYYYKKREAAKRAPTKFLSVIVDGMDQSKSNLPHFVGRTAKAVNSADQLKTHISGVIAHGQNEFFTFLDIGQYPHDSNLTINIILQILFKIKDIMGGKLPPTFYLQADNCWRENKNKFVLAFCEYLVHIKVFREVHLSFLMVGHTHEDIDACFSKVADKLRRNDAETLDDLIELLPNVKVINFIYDFRTWIQNSICDLRKHTRPLHFKFRSNESLVETFYKGKYDSPWKKLEGGIMARNNQQKIISIRGSPKLSPINFDGIGLERISSQLKHWKCLFSDQINQTQYHWWERFLKLWKKCEENSSERRRLFFANAQWILPMLPKQLSHDENEEENLLPDTIQNMMNDELIEPVVLSK
ncbi:uncharacterized protein LOC133201246 [Saccostrea echinata]|uniref:uncharacterized protein LOC133201246 n=1 Tax=Saccostrea echinata TaxID=191078 RepID=UPI002A81EF84|nr:uncharacterized protein LOC133201246 [Saccostrea echinata]